MSRSYPVIAAVLAAFALAAWGAGAVRAAPAPSPTPLSADDQALVDKAAAYLDGLGEAKGQFVQTDARGNVSHGELYLQRPGKARFDYAAPASLLVIADGQMVFVIDGRLQTVNRYLQGSTPLALFLQRHVRLDQKVVVSKVERVPGGFRLTAHDGRHQARGQITLTFWDNPMMLKQWSIVDAEGARTTVDITDLQPASGLDPRLFRAPKETTPYG